MDKSKKRKPKNGEPNIWISSLISGGIGLGVIVAMLLIIPAIIITTDNPKAYISMGAIFCCLAGGITAGIIAASIAKGAEIQAAALASAVIAVPVLLISFVAGKGFDFLWFAIIMGSIVLSALAAAFTLLKISKNKKPNMKKLMKRR